MVRWVDDALDKDLITWKPVNTKTYWNRYRKSLSLAGIAAYGDVPILSAFYRMLGRGAKGKVVELPSQGLTRLAERMKSGKVTDQARVSFMLAYGYTPDQQLMLESYYDRMTPTFRLCSSPFDLREKREIIHVNQ